MTRIVAARNGNNNRRNNESLMLNIIISTVRCFGTIKTVTFMGQVFGGM